jgi:putative resolvase
MKISIAKAAEELGVSRDTLRRWEKAGKIKVERTAKGHRRYNLATLLGSQPRRDQSGKKTVVYARVSSHDQKEDLSRQVQVLESFCAANGWVYSFEDELVQDVLEIITVFSARLYGARSRKNKKLLDALKEAAEKL